MDAPVMTAPVGVGELVAGKYRVERLLGAGGMGVVVQAQHLHLAQPVAIKFLQAGANRTSFERFVREAQTAAKIQSEHVTRVLDIDQLPTGEPYLVMELLQGQDLKQLLHNRGALPAPEALSYLLQACEALAEAHVQGIVHRDLKPANLFLCQRADGSPNVKVLDFGISKYRPDAGKEHGDPSLTSASAVFGSPRYMSPEQLRASRDVDARADIWSLGVVFYELLSGSPPFGGTMAELCVRVLNEAPQPLRQLRPDTPELVEAVILRCLHKEPEYRFTNLAQLALALQPVASATVALSIDRIVKICQAAGWPTQLGELPVEAERQAELAPSGPASTSRAVASVLPPSPSVPSATTNSDPVTTHLWGQQQPGPQQPGYQQASYQQPGPQQPGYQQASYQQASYQQASYQQASYQQPGPQGPAVADAVTAAPGKTSHTGRLIAISAGVVLALAAATLTIVLVVQRSSPAASLVPATSAKAGGPSATTARAGPPRASESESVIDRLPTLFDPFVKAVGGPVDVCDMTVHPTWVTMRVLDPPRYKYVSAYQYKTAAKKVVRKDSMAPMCVQNPKGRRFRLTADHLRLARDVWRDALKRSDGGTISHLAVAMDFAGSKPDGHEKTMFRFRAYAKNGRENWIIYYDRRGRFLQSDR